LFQGGECKSVLSTMKVGEVYTFRSDRALGPFRGTVQSLTKVAGGTLVVVSDIRPLHPRPDAPVYLVTSVFVRKERRTRKNRSKT